MIFMTESGSVYQVEGDKARRLGGNQRHDLNGQLHLGPDGEWRLIRSHYVKDNRLYLLWASCYCEPRCRMPVTITSPIVGRSGEISA